MSNSQPSVPSCTGGVIWYTMNALLRNGGSWKILFEPFKVGTEYLSGEKYIMISAVGPLVQKSRLKENSVRMTHLLSMK